MEYFSREEVERIGQAGARLHPGYPDKMIARYLSSFWLEIEPQDKAFTPHYMTGFWEAWITAWVSRQFESHRLFLDVGSNVGYYAMMAARAGLKTYAFEPQGELQEMIAHSARLNGLDVTIEPFALGAKQGKIKFIIPDGHSGAGMVSQTAQNPDFAHRRIMVDVEALDNYGLKGPLLIKIDAEGSEPEVLAGAKETLAREKATIFLEWDGARGYSLFADYLFDNFESVNLLNFKGNEETLTLEELKSLKDLQTIIVRNYK